MPGKDDNISNIFGLYEDEVSTLEEQDIENDPRDLMDESLDIRS